jgi:hypothetical protein
MHEVERHSAFEVLDLLREAVGESREPAHPHPHRQVLALDVAVEMCAGLGSPQTVPLIAPQQRPWL